MQILKLAKVFVTSALLSTALLAEESESTFSVAHGWPQLPEGFALQIVGGVAADDQGRVYSIHSAGRAWPDRNTEELIADKTIFVWDAETGELIESWADHTFRMTHSLEVDNEGNLWATDVGLHQVFKFSSEGELLLAIGERGVPGDSPGFFNMPTDIVILEDGSFYVSDGYGNNRIIKYSADGEYQFEWGGKGTEPGQFNLPHSVVVDSEGRVYAADRTNARIQIFTAKGDYISEIKTEGWIPYSLAISDDDRLFVSDGGDKPAKYPFRSRIVVMDLEGNIEQTFGRYGNYNGQFLLAHDVTLAPNGDVYIADVVGNRVHKFTEAKN